MTKRLSLCFASSRVFQPFILFFCLLLAVSSCNPQPSIAQSWGGKMTLDKAISKIAKTLVAQGELKGQLVLISPHDIYDIESGLSLPLALLIREKMVAEMMKSGVKVLLPGVDENQFMILQGTWQRQKSDLHLNMKVMKLTPIGPVAVAAESSKVPIDEVGPMMLEPDRESWSRYLVRKLEDNATDQDQRTVHLRNFKLIRFSGAETGATTDSEGYFSNWLRPALQKSRLFQPLDQQRGIKGISVGSIRQLAKRLVTRPDEENVPETGLTTDVLMADTELSGSAYIDKKKGKVEIHLQVRERRGSDFSSATADVPTDVFHSAIINPPAPPKLPPVDPGITTPVGNVSVSGLTVDITTDRGEGQPYYKKGERVRFVIRMNRAAWLYLFDLDSMGHAVLLYPVDTNTGRLVQRSAMLAEPGKPIVLPEDGASYKVVAIEPFGKDTVWAVASERPLRMPEKLVGEWADSHILIQRLREQGFSGRGGYAEAPVELVTGR